MKREFIKNLLPDASDEVIDKIMAEHGKTMNTLKVQVETLTTERDGLKTQLGTANETIQTYKDMDIDGIRKSAKDWEDKHKTDTAALQAKIDQQAYGFAVERAVSGEKFSSSAARKAFIADLTAKGLKLEGEKLIGYDDFKKSYQEADPAAFESDTPAPQVVSKTGGGLNNLGPDAAMRAALGLPTKKE